MLLNNVTIADVQSIYAQNIAQQKSPADARCGTRTSVHELLQAQNSMPYPLPPASREFNVSGIVVGPSGFKIQDPALAASEVAARNADLAARKSKMHSLVTDAEVLASERARSGPDGGHTSAHHYVQKQHGIQLWQAADKLVSDALGGAT
jgi:hypothetical protein